MSVSSDAPNTEDPLVDVARQLRAIHESYLLGPKQLSLVLQDVQRLQVFLIDFFKHFLLQDLDGRLDVYLTVLLQNDNDRNAEATKHRLLHLRDQIYVSFASKKVYFEIFRT